jgi:hypothetical protein
MTTDLSYSQLSAFDDIKMAAFQISEVVTKVAPRRQGSESSLLSCTEWL